MEMKIENYSTLAFGALVIAGYTPGDRVYGVDTYEKIDIHENGSIAKLSELLESSGFKDVTEEYKIDKAFESPILSGKTVLVECVDGVWTIGVFDHPDA